MYAAGLWRSHAAPVGSGGRRGLSASVPPVMDTGIVLGGEGRLPTCRAFPPVGFFRPQASGTSRRRQKPKAHPAVRGRKPCPPTAAAGMHGRGKATVHAQRDVRVRGPVHVTSGTAQQMRTSTIRECSSSKPAAVAPARCLLAPDLI